MATLFDTNFSFSAPSSPSSTDDSTTCTRSSSRAVSPCSTAPAYPPPRFSMTDLSAHFASQNLRTPNAQMAYESCDAYANLDGDEEGWAIPSAEDDEDDATVDALRRVRSYSPGRRERRQQTARLLCTTNHRGEIAALVARMVARGEQCAVSSSPTTGCQEDEGYGSDNDEMMSGTSAGSSRRPSLIPSRSRLDSKGGAACVKKNVRVRKGTKERR